MQGDHSVVEWKGFSLCICGLFIAHILCLKKKNQFKVGL